MSFIFFFKFCLVSGVIKLKNKKKQFQILSDCNSVHVKSLSTLTKHEHVMVDDIRYQGGSQINQIVPTNVTVSITSGEYWPTTSLHWNCTQWGEWTPSRDGTCRYVIRPLYDEAMTRGKFQYKLNQTCSKFLLC